MSPQANPPTEVPTGKAKYRVTNGPEYDRALGQRGNLTSWCDEALVRERWRRGSLRLAGMGR